MLEGAIPQSAVTGGGVVVVRCRLPASRSLLMFLSDTGAARAKNQLAKRIKMISPDSNVYCCRPISKNQKVNFWVISRGAR